MKLEKTLNKLVLVLLIIDILCFLSIVALGIVIFLFNELNYLVFVILGIALVAFVISVLLLKKRVGLIEKQTNNLLQSVTDGVKAIEGGVSYTPINLEIEEYNDVLNTLKDTSHVFEERVYHIRDLSELNLQKTDTLEPLDLDTFKEQLHMVLTKTAMYRTAVLLVRIAEDNNHYSEKAFKHLKTMIETYLKPEQVGLFDDRTYAIYLPFVSSSSTIVEKAKRLTKEFHDLDVTAEDEIAVYYAKVGIALYPYVEEDKLIDYALTALETSQNVSLIAPTYTTDFLRDLQNISLEEHYRRGICAIENLKVRLNSSSSLSHMRDLVQHTIIEITTMFGFENGALLMYRPLEHVYECVYEYADRTRNLAFAQKKTLSGVELVDYAKMFDHDGSFFGTIEDDFPPSVFSLFDNLKIKYFYHSKIEHLSQTIGYLCFNGYSEMPKELSIQDKQILFTLTNMLSMLIGETLFIEDKIRSETMLASLLRREQKYCYMINERTYRLTYVSPDLKRLYPNAETGKICYQVFESEEATSPCLHCPLKVGRGAIARPAIGENLVASVLTRAQLTDMETCITIEDVMPINANVTSRELSPVLQIFNKLRLTRDLTSEIKEQKTGYVLFFNISNHKNLVKNITKVGVEHLLISLVKRLQTYGYEANVYHYSESCLAFLFQGFTHKNLLDEAEKLFAIMSESLQNADGHKCVLSYHVSMLTYPGDFFGESVTSVIEKTIKEADNIGLGRLYAGNVKDYRSLDRKTYILECIDKAIQTDGFEIYLQPIVSKETLKPVAAEILLRLNDPSRGFISPREFVPLASEEGKMFRIEQSLIASLGEMWRTYGFGIFSSVGMDHISVNISKDSALHPDFFDKVAGLIKRYQFPKGFLRFEFQASLLKNEAEVVHPLINKLREIGVSIAMDSFNMENDVTGVLSEVKLDELKLGFECVRDFDNKTRTLESFQYLIDIAAHQGFRFTAEGVETLQQVEMLSKMSVSYYQGFYFAKPMPREEFIRFLNFGK